MSTSEQSVQPLSEPIWWSAAQVAAAIAARHISAREYLDDRLAQVSRYNRALNLVVTIDERAVDAAKRADEAVVRGEPLGPLHGVAVTVKDALATAGLRTTAGMAMLASYVPRQDASAVAGLRRAGAIVFGKTNLAEGSGDLQAFNELFGLARNPWHPDYSPSGSSGGAAAAVAAGFTPLELGSDVAGSIRLPAANCGVVGHKPSFGVVAVDGHVPPAPLRLRALDLNVIGPLARCVDDAELVLDAIAGPAPWDRAAWQLRLPPARTVCRVATWFDDPYCPVDPQVVGALEAAAGALADTGVSVVADHPPGVKLRSSDALFQQLLSTVALSGYTREQVEQIATGARAPGPELGARHVDQRLWDWAHADEARLRLRERWRQFFTRYEAILLPVSASLAIAHDMRPFDQRRITVGGTVRGYWEQTIWAGLAGVSYLPSTVVPAGLDPRGVPIGIAVMADYLDDRTALEVARRLCAALPPIGRPPLHRWAGGARDVEHAQAGVLEQPQLAVLDPRPGVA